MWSDRELAILKQCYPKGGSRDCFGKLDRSRKAIRNKASLLGIKTVCLNGHPPKKIIQVFGDNRCIAVCAKHGQVEHYFYKNQTSPICVRCQKERDAGRPNPGRTERRRQIERRAARRRRSTPLGNYENRLRVSLASYLGGKASFSRNLPYSAQELCVHLEAIRQRQNNACPMCGNSYANTGYDIDHIIPLSSAQTEQEALGLFDLSNLSLLCPHCSRYVKKDNLPK